MHAASIRRWLVVGVVAFGMLAMACDSSSTGTPDETVNVTVSAEVIATDLRVIVATTPIVQIDTADGPLSHEVVVTWDGDEPIVLDDARFTHHIEGDHGDLVTAGRGCGVQWEGELLQACTADLQIIRLEPGEQHAYPVQIHAEVGPLTLGPGTYVLEETISYWTGDSIGENGIPSGEADGSFVIRLTYEVE